MPVPSHINGLVKLKPESIGDPNMYLGAKLSKAEIKNMVFGAIHIAHLRIYRKLVGTV
jgi:hypothetical protein